jgi:transglycosylase-like protein with SLT domain
MGQATLGGVPFRIDPDSVAWSFAMKVSRRKTVGGDVVQVYGTELGDMTVTGVFGYGDRSRGDQNGWEDQERFRRQVEAWVDGSVDTAGARPLRFLYPPRRWDFQVLVRGYTGAGGSGAAIEHANETFNPRWTLALFVVEDSTRRVIAGIKDLYVSRLMNGVGWKQSSYNGPLTQADVDQVLAPYGGDLRGYLVEQFNQAAGVPDRTDTSTSSGQAATGSNVDGWITQAEQVLGTPFTAGERDAIKIVSKHESGDNPKAQNLTPAGIAAGRPQGLLQMTIATFQGHKRPGYEDVFDPVASIIADTDYVKKYGGWEHVPGVLTVRAGRAYVPY